MRVHLAGILTAISIDSGSEARYRHRAILSLTRTRHGQLSQHTDQVRDKISTSLPVIASRTARSTTTHTDTVPAPEEANRGLERPFGAVLALLRCVNDFASRGGEGGRTERPSTVVLENFRVSPCGSPLLLSTPSHAGPPQTRYLLREARAASRSARLSELMSKKGEKGSLTSLSATPPFHLPFRSAPRAQLCWL